MNMTFNNETNIGKGNKHNNEQQQSHQQLQSEHRTGRWRTYFLCSLIFS